MEAVGGSTRIRVDARVLAATNKDLTEEIRAGRFREDLYFRLNVVPIFVPPLRERPEDIPLLADHFMALLAREYGRRAEDVRGRRGGGAAALRLARQRARAAQPGRAADDHGAGRAWSPPATCAFLGQGARGRGRAPARRRPHRAAARRARRVREGLHPARARGAAGQHVADRRRARRRAQQPVSQDARASASRRRGGRTTTWSRRDAAADARRHPDPGADRRRRGARPEHRARWRGSSPTAPAGCGRTSRRTRRRRSPGASSRRARASA